MAQVINTNISSLNAQRNLNTSQSALATSLQRLSSGLRINSAKDDAAGLAISDRMTSQIRGLNQAARNANDGVSLAQTAEGGLAEVGNNLQRMRELAVQSANATNTASDRASLQAEVDQLLAEIQRVATTTQFNGQNILDGTFTSAQFQVGANANQTIIATTGNSQTSAIGSFQATGTTAVSSGALASGDLLINGTDVGVSTSSSAESKATAINAISTLTGVTASAKTVTSSTNTLLRNQTLQAGDLVINGVNLGAIAGSNNIATRGANIAAAVNAVSNQTGVTATSNLATGALTLNSATGKDIAITSTTGDAGAQRLANATGLVTVSGSPTASTNTVTFANGVAGVTTITAADGDITSGDTFAIQGKTYEFSAGTSTATHIYLGTASGTAATDIGTLRTAMQVSGRVNNATVAGAGATLTVTSNVLTATTTHTDVTFTDADTSGV
ncbi:MAG: flagellin, partial [Rhodocyclaceae bacterium]|nr:flagellin [Rhodocyclaceae bacterium]